MERKINDYNSLTKLYYQRSRIYPNTYQNVRDLFKMFLSFFIPVLMSFKVGPACLNKSSWDLSMIEKHFCRSLFIKSYD